MIKFGSLRGSIGHLILNTLRFFLEKKKIKKLIIISTPKKDISNHYVYKILREKFTNKNIIFVNSKILNLIYKFFNKLRKYKFFSNLICNIEWLHHENANEAYGSKYNFDENFYHLVPNFDIADKEIEFFLNWKNKNKLKKKYVCISSRDPGFYNEKIQNPRNFSFKDYDILIKMLLSKGYSVIRMGRKYKDSYDFKDHNYIELYNIEKENKNLDQIETLLFKYCEFIVSGNSGIDAFAALFKKKIFIVNNFPAGRKPRYLNCTYIPQIYTQNKNLLKFKDIPKKILLSEEVENLKYHNINLLKASSTDILQMVKENIESEKFVGVDISNEDFIIEGKKSKSNICPVWFKKNYNLFK